MRRWTLGGPVEEPGYAVVHAERGFEVRSYGAVTVAEVEVDGGYLEGGNGGFRVLAGYIFGGNEGEQSIAMTAPVAMAPAASAGRSVMTFAMPSGRTVSSLPRPRDPRVTLRELPPQHVAAMRFSGRWEPRDVEERLAALARDAEAAGWRASGPPRFARYDPPWTPPFLRRNEILLPVVPR